MTVLGVKLIAQTCRLGLHHQIANARLGWWPPAVAILRLGGLSTQSGIMQQVLRHRWQLSSQLKAIIHKALVLSRYGAIANASKVKRDRKATSNLGDASVQHIISGLCRSPLQFTIIRAERRALNGRGPLHLKHAGMASLMESY